MSKISARITKDKHYNNYAYYNVEVRSQSKEQSEKVCYILLDKLEQELAEHNATYNGGCPWIIENKHSIIYGDSLVIDFYRGLMQDIHKDVMQIWKQAKKELGIR